MSTGYASAAEMRRDVSVLLRPPRRMPVAEAVKKYMRVPMGGGSAVQWEDTL
ncbi:phage terminase large subunit family protein, partial [Morganella morganii]